MKTLAKTKIEAVLNQLAEKAEVYVPLKQGAISSFGVWSAAVSGENLALESLNTLMSPKSVVLPQTEKMYTFSTSGQQAEVKEVCADSGERVIFGARACDTKSLNVLDEVFLTRGYEDAFYKARREKLTVIGRACAQPGPHCFCSSMGVDPLEPAGADVILYDAGEEFGWEPVTERGQALTNQLNEFLGDRELPKPSAAEFRTRVDIEGLPEKLNRMFAHPVWEELAAKCMNCGICTYLCPGCYCFDIQVKTRGQEGYRFRCWDSCMYPEYTQMAGGHNPRQSKHERFRNRFLHKLEFIHERYGTLGCTGCGRCVVMCPNGVNIVSIINRLREVDVDVR